MLEAASRLLDDTIVALATGRSRSAIGVIRLSGMAPNIDEILAGCVRLRHPSALQPRKVRRFDLIEVNTGDIIDEGLLVRFAAPHSYTGEDVVEFSLHGSPFLLERCVEALVLSGARPAAPGEFTRRAVINGKLSLLEAEGVGATVDASSRGAARLARKQLGGELASRIASWRVMALEVAAAFEAVIDFPEEIEEEELTASFDRVSAVRSAMERLAGSYRAGRSLVRGWDVVLTGPVNAGKSTLFNALLRFDRAIVTEIPGTTRDVVSETVEWQGTSVRLQDTAGIRVSSDPVEQLGVERGGAAVEGADLRLCVRNGVTLLKDQTLELPDEVASSFHSSPAIAVATHADLLSERDVVKLKESGWYPVGSGLDSAIDDLQAEIVSQAESSQDFEECMIHTARQYGALVRAAEHLCQAEEHGSVEPALAALEFRMAAGALEEFLGRWDHEDVLDTLFEQFCIGK